MAILDNASTHAIPENAPAVLLIDDDNEIRETASILLGANGYRVFAAGSRAEAMEVLPKKQIHVVIQDLILPDARDIDLFNEIRGVRPTMPVIICTGIGFARIKREMLRAPLVFYLEKPYTCSALCASIMGALCAAAQAPRTGIV